VTKVTNVTARPLWLQLTSRKPLWLDLQPVDIKSRWRHHWKSAQVVNFHLVCNTTIQQPGFDLPRQQWCLLNCFRTEQGHCCACRRKWRLTDTDVLVARPRQCSTLSTVESCPLTKLNGGLSCLHSADKDAVSWLTSYGSWHAYEKKCHVAGMTTVITGNRVWRSMSSSESRRQEVTEQIVICCRRLFQIRTAVTGIAR